MQFRNNTVLDVQVICRKMKDFFFNFSIKIANGVLLAWPNLVKDF